MALDATVSSPTKERSIDLLALDEALTRLAAIDPDLVRVVELRYFSGMSVTEAAKTLGTSRTQVSRDWQMAKSWLRRELTR